MNTILQIGSFSGFLVVESNDALDWSESRRSEELETGRNHGDRVPVELSEHLIRYDYECR